MSILYCYNVNTIQAVQEEAEEYLLQQNCDRIYALVASEVMLEVLVDVIQIYFGDQVNSSNALVGELYELIYAHYRSSGGGSDGSGGSGSGGSSAMSSPSALNRMQRRSTYRMPGTK